MWEGCECRRGASMGQVSEGGCDYGMVRVWE